MILGAICRLPPKEVEFRPLYGVVAQLGERRVRNAKVEGSIPFRSTIFPVRAGVDDHPGVPP